jgi:hypothetical protein
MKRPVPDAIDILDEPVAAGRMVESAALRGSRLEQLRLTDEDLAALKRQGTVQIEHRDNRSIAKVRFRRGGKQMVRYIGGAEAGRQVEEELRRWQAVHRKCRAMLGLAKITRAALRGSKKVLAPYLEQIGYRYHGWAIRRWREPPPHSARP